MGLIHTVGSEGAKLFWVGWLFELMAVQSLKNRLFCTASKKDLVDDRYRNHILVDIAPFHGFRVQATTLEQTTPL